MAIETSPRCSDTADDAESYPDCAVAFAAAADVRSSSCPTGCTYTATPDYSGSLTFTTPMETGFYTLALYDEIECTDPRPCDEVVEEKPDIISLSVRVQPPCRPRLPLSPLAAPLFCRLLAAETERGGRPG
eukprot:COSAG04_NODE_1095_length_8308_cov_5.921793_10_plen_131_part_00